MNVNEIRYFERKMTDSAFDDAVKYDRRLQFVQSEHGL